MGYVKRFGDFCAAFAAFSAFMYLFCQYMAMDFKELEGFSEKIKFFFSNEPRRDYRSYLALLVLILLSFAVSVIFHKLPALTLGTASLPMILAVVMFDGEKLYERPMLYFVLLSVHFGGCLFECLRRDRQDRHRRSAIATDILGLCIMGFCLYILYISKDIVNIDFKDINIVERTLYSAVVYFDADLSWFRSIAIFFGAIVFLRIVLRDLYYIDAFLSLIPLGAAIWLWHTDGIPVFGSVVAVLTLLYAIARISVMLFCKPKCISEKDTEKGTAVVGS